MKIKITKDQIITALYTEPLKPGLFLKIPPKAGLEIKKNVACPVCAVGALMSAALPNETLLSIADLASELTKDTNFSEEFDTNTHKDAEGKVINHLEHGEYLSALSTYFEHGARLEGNYDFGGFANLNFRIELADFVTAHFPKTLTLDTEKSY